MSKNPSAKQFLHSLIIVDSALEVVEDTPEQTLDVIAPLMNEKVAA